MVTSFRDKTKESRKGAINNESNDSVLSWPVNCATFNAWTTCMSSIVAGIVFVQVNGFSRVKRAKKSVCTAVSTMDRKEQEISETEHRESLILFARSARCCSANGTIVGVTFRAIPNALFIHSFIRCAFNLMRMVFSAIKLNYNIF